MLRDNGSWPDIWRCKQYGFLGFLTRAPGPREAPGASGGPREAPLGYLWVFWGPGGLREAPGT